MRPLSPIQADALPDFCFEERGGTKIWVARRYANSGLVNQVADCDLLLARPDCRIIKDQKKIKVGCLSLDVTGKESSFYIKRYNAFSLRYRIGSLLALSGAVRSLRGAALLQSARIHTATPVAAVESRVKGVLTKSFFITEEICGGKTADAYWREDLTGSRLSHLWQRRRNFLAGLASVFRSLHAAEIYHNDLKDANILAVPRPSELSQTFYLLDLEGVRRYNRLSEKRRIKNLVQINRTLGRYVSRSDKFCFLKSYLAAEAADKRQAIRMIQIIIAESDRLDMVKRAKLSACLRQPRGKL
jgi:hypothetical protein